MEASDLAPADSELGSELEAQRGEHIGAASTKVTGPEVNAPETENGPDLPPNDLAVVGSDS